MYLNFDMEELEHTTIIEWCCRQQYYNAMLTHAKDACDICPSEGRLQILLSLAYVLTGKIHEAIKVSSSFISNHTDETLAALVIQSLVYRGNGNTERTSIAQIDAKIREERRKASVVALSLTASVLLLSGKVDKAKDYLDRAFKANSSHTDVLLVKGWIDLYPSDEANTRKCDYFQLILKEDAKHFGALLGSARYKQHHGDHAGAIFILNSLIVRYPKLCLPLAEKLFSHLTVKDWEQVLECANRMLSIEANNLDGIKARAIMAVCRDGDYDKALSHIQLFFRNLIIAEPKNVVLFTDNIQLFSRVTCRNYIILTELTKIAEKILQQIPKSGDVMAELGNLYVALEKPKEAEHWYRNTIHVDESSFAALMGLAQCQLLDTSVDAMDLAKQQVDFLMEIQSNITNPALLIMSAKTCGDQPKAWRYLNMAVTIILKNCENIPYGYEYLQKLNPDLCLQIAKQCMCYSPNQMQIEEQVNGRMEKAPNLLLLEQLVDACPGLTAALLMLSRVKLHAGDLDGALAILKELLNSVDSSNAEAHLLMAQILARQEQYQLASQSLEVGLSYNFKIRDNPVYHLITGMVQKESGDIESAIKSFQVAMSFAGLKFNKNAVEVIPVGLSDKAALYLELISAYSTMKKFDDALALIEDAKIEFAGTIEEGRIIIGNAELYLEMCDVDEAIDCLAKILPDEPYYVQAHTKLAHISLRYRHDRQMFAKCFRELVEHCPGAETYSMLGDAYMSIQEPDRAIDAYEQALSKSSVDKALLANKMGKALIKTHQYGKAVNYYKDMIKLEGCRSLKIELAELYKKMKQYDKAEATLVQELQDGRGITDLQLLEIRGQQLLLLARVREKGNNIQGALSTLKDAKENQTRCIRLSKKTDTGDQKQMLANICLNIADHASSLRDYDQAIQHYKEALNYKPNDVKALLSLAKLYMQMNNLDRCTQSCTALLNADPTNEAASVMLADLAFRKVDFETAAFHFRQLLVGHPTYWTALARLIEVSRRTGNMDDLNEWLHRAEVATGTTNKEAGFYYCAGLLDWRTAKLNSALRHFNFARRDPEWGQQAIYNMIEICLDPDDDSSLSNEAFNDEDNTEYHDARTMALKTAYRLLQELNPKGGAHEMLMHRLLSNFFLLATKQKSNIEKALADCTALASQEALRDHVGPALGMATAHILLKQTPRARNHLKRVSKNTWTFEDAEYLERCWLLLADIYAQSNKSDLANELLKRVLQHNATCVRAHELSGYIAEKDQNYREAAIRYSQAWKYGGRCKLSVGYKLAYCCLKAKAYADAIEACNEVLRQNVDYPRIRKDILEKCIHNLRT